MDIKFISGNYVHSTIFDMNETFENCCFFILLLKFVVFLF